MEYLLEPESIVGAGKSDLTNNWVKSLVEILQYLWLAAKGPAGIEYSGIMEASHEIALIVSAYQKGIRNFDPENAFKAVLHQQTTPGVVTPENSFAGNKFDSYMKLGYVPTEGRPGVQYIGICI